MSLFVIVSDYLECAERVLCVISNILSSLALLSCDNLLSALLVVGANLSLLAQTCLRISLPILEQIVLKEKSSPTSTQRTEYFQFHYLDLKL